MARNHYTLISRLDIISNNRFVIAIRKRSFSTEFVFFAGRRIGRTNTYAVHVYGHRGLLIDRFLMLRTQGHWQIRRLVAIRSCEWRLVTMFYRELSQFGSNDMRAAVWGDLRRKYVTDGEAVKAIAMLWELAPTHLEGLRLAVAHAAYGGEGR